MLCSGVLLPSYERRAESQRDENAGQIKVTCVFLSNCCLEFSLFRSFRTRLFNFCNKYSTSQIDLRGGNISAGPWCLHIRYEITEYVCTDGKICVSLSLHLQLSSVRIWGQGGVENVN